MKTAAKPTSGGCSMELTLRSMAGQELAVVSAESSWTVDELKQCATSVTDSRILELFLETHQLPGSETLEQLGLENGMVLLAVVGKSCVLDADGQPVLGFLEEEHRSFLAEAVAAEVGPHAQDLRCWRVLAAASTADDQQALPRTFKNEFVKVEKDLASNDWAYLFLFRTCQGYIAGAFRVGFSAADEHAFIFSLVRPLGSGPRGIPFVPGVTELSREPITLKVRPDSANDAIYTGGGAMFCFGAGNTGEEDFDFHCGRPFVTSNLKSYGPPGTDPVLLFGGGEKVTNGDRFEYRPDIMLAYQIPLKAEQ